MTSTAPITWESPEFGAWLQSFGPSGWVVEFTTLQGAWNTYAHDELIRCEVTGLHFLPKDCVRGFDGLWRHMDYETQGMAPWQRADLVRGQEADYHRDMARDGL